MKKPVSALLALCLASAANAEQATVAVAANFAWPMGELEALFEEGGIHELTVVHGSTGQLYAQIVNGAPHDVFLAADRERPRRLAEAGLGNAPFTYALGRLALWTREPRFDGDLTVNGPTVNDATDNGLTVGDLAVSGPTVDGLTVNNLEVGGLTLDVLADGDFRRLAIANPRLAPYGVAAKETLQALGLWEPLQEKIVLGENVGQAFAMAETRNAELGLVALSAAVAYTGTAAYVPVPPEHHGPIRQDAILMNSGLDNPAALTFIDFLRGADARRIIAEAGFELP